MCGLGSQDCFEVNNLEKVRLLVVWRWLLNGFKRGHGNNSDLGPLTSMAELPCSGQLSAIYIHRGLHRGFCGLIDLTMHSSTFSPFRAINPTPLHQSSFSRFGTVISSPLPPSVNNFPNTPPPDPSVVAANQNTALKSLDITQMRNLYASAPSGKEAKTVMNMFSCFPRALHDAEGKGQRCSVFDVRILERHPFTTQTFIPLSSSTSAGSSSETRETETRYLVIVAPTSSPIPNTRFAESGPPDLARIEAFWAHRGQAVTYGAGTWHAPMVVIGQERVDFVVVQFANGISEEDCQEIYLNSEEGEEGVCMVIDGQATDLEAKL